MLPRTAAACIEQSLHTCRCRRADNAAKVAALALRHAGLATEDGGQPAAAAAASPRPVRIAGVPSSPPAASPTAAPAIAPAAAAATAGLAIAAAGPRPPLLACSASAAASVPQSPHAPAPPGSPHSPGRARSSSGGSEGGSSSPATSSACSSFTSGGEDAAAEQPAAEPSRDSSPAVLQPCSSPQGSRSSRASLHSSQSTQQSRHTSSTAGANSSTASRTSSSSASYASAAGSPVGSEASADASDEQHTASPLPSSCGSVYSRPWLADAAADPSVAAPALVPAAGGADASRRPAPRPLPTFCLPSMPTQPPAAAAQQQEQQQQAPALPGLRVGQSAAEVADAQCTEPSAAPHQPGSSHSPPAPHLAQLDSGSQRLQEQLNRCAPGCPLISWPRVSPWTAISEAALTPPPFLALPHAGWSASWHAAGSSAQTPARWQLRRASERPATPGAAATRGSAGLVRLQRQGRAAPAAVRLAPAPAGAAAPRRGRPGPIPLCSTRGLWDLQMLLLRVKRTVSMQCRVQMVV